MIFELQFQQKHQFEITLVNNPAITAWLNFYTRSFNHYFCYSYKNELSETFEIVNYNNASHWFDILVQNLDKIKQYNLEFDKNIPEKYTDVNRKWLNDAHRFYTVSAANYLTYALENDPATLILDNINEAVHKIESSITKNPPNCPVKLIKQIHCEQKHIGEIFKFDLDWKKYHSKQHYDIILDANILGKSLLQSYLDEDDPTQWDTNGHEESLGALLICLDKNRSKIYESSSWQNWLEKYSAKDENLYYDFPVGNFTDPNATNTIAELFEKTTGIIQAKFIL